jgi:hypothetical protein
MPSHSAIVIDHVGAPAIYMGKLDLLVSRRAEPTLGKSIALVGSDAAGAELDPAPHDLDGFVPLATARLQAATL